MVSLSLSMNSSSTSRACYFGHALFSIDAYSFRWTLQAYSLVTSSENSGFRRPSEPSAPKTWQTLQVFWSRCISRQQTEPTVLVGLFFPSTFLQGLLVSEFRGIHNTNIFPNKLWLKNRSSIDYQISRSLFDTKREFL